MTCSVSWRSEAEVLGSEGLETRNVRVRFRTEVMITLR